MRKFACAAAAALAMAGTAFAAPITFTFSTANADFLLNGSSGGDLVITLRGDTTNYVAAPPGPFGSNRYLGLSGTVSSTSLGLSNVALTNTLDLLIGAPDQSISDFVGLSDGSGVVGLTSVVGSSSGGLISGWDRISNFSASQMLSVANNVAVTLSYTGGSVSLFRIDGIGGPNGGALDGAFSAALVTTPGTVPEPTALALVLLALGAGALVTRRRAG